MGRAGDSEQLLVTHRPMLSVVIPCHNEADSVSVLLPSLRRSLDRLVAAGVLSGFETIVVDDGSSDQTPALLLNHSWVEVLRSESRSGYGHALKQGFGHARGTLIAFMDMDNTYEPDDLGVLVSTLVEEKLDVVLGDRLSQGRGMPLLRKIGNRFFSALTRRLLQYPVRDACTGYRVFDRRLTPRLCALSQDNLEFSLSMTLWMIRERVRFREIPIRYHRRDGVSKLRVIEDGFRFLWTILSFPSETLSRDRLLDHRTDSRTG